MKCKRCSMSAVFSNPAYCKKHFIEYIEKQVQKTIKDFKLINNRDRVVVAVSGGKDSLSCLYMLSRWYKNVSALAIDEGIAGYRNATLKDLKRFCKEHKIELEIISCKDEFGMTLDRMLKKIKEKPCTVCGAIRRYLINKHARKLKATKVATGHNLDDEAQSVLMNLFRNQVSVSARLGPVTGIIKDKRFIPRIKPLYLCTEKEITAYSYLMDFGVSFVECPYTGESYRRYVLERLNEYEQKHPGTKRNIIRGFLKELPNLKKKYMTELRPASCESCGEPSMQRLCRVCLIMSKLKKV